MLVPDSKLKKQKNSSKSTKQLKKIDKNYNKLATSSSKKSLKVTPNHSKQKSNDLITKNPKLESIARSDYYTTYPHCKNPSQNKQLPNTHEQLIHSKKHRRNNTQLLKEKQKNFNDIYQTKQKNDYDQPIYFQDVEADSDNRKKNPLFKKIKMLSSEGSIDFNGQIVRKNRFESDVNKNLLGNQHKTCSNYYSPAPNELKRKNSKKKSSSKIKSSDKKIKNTSKNHRKQKRILKQEQCKQSRKSGLISEHIKNNGASVQRSKISFLVDQKCAINSLSNQEKMQDIYQQIQEDTQGVYEYILSQQLIKERGQCLNMLGKICSSMNLKRQTFSIAMCYMDSFIDINTEVKTVKTIAIASLMMGLKLDHAEAIGSGAQMETLSSIQSFTVNKGLSISTEARSQQKRSSKKHQSSKYNDQQSSKQPKFNLNRPKLPNVLTTVLSHQQIFSEYDRILCKQEIMDMQMQMMVKLNFKLTLKSFTYWVETLTSIWDCYINQFKPKLKGKIVFKSQQNLKNLSYLYQLVQISYYFPYAYFYPKSILVLSIMYLLIRIRIEFSGDKEDKGFEHYKTNLGKSTNIIFIDKMGSNQLFGEFLGFFHLDMGDIVNCCQYVSHYLSHKILRVFLFDSNRSMTYDQHAVLYHYNPQIFRFFQLKYSNCIDKELV